MSGEILFCGTKFKTFSPLICVVWLNLPKSRWASVSEFIQVASEKSDNTIPAAVVDD